MTVKTSRKIDTKKDEVVIDYGDGFEFADYKGKLGDLLNPPAGNHQMTQPPKGKGERAALRNRNMAEFTKFSFEALARKPKTAF